jgi:hypothetical protein
MIYLASPYSDMSIIVRQSRYLKARKFMAKTLKEGINIISPIVIWHEIAINENMGVTFDEFECFDLELLSICSELWILKLKNWENSKGIKSEIARARMLGINVKYVDYEN